VSNDEPGFDEIPDGRLPTPGPRTGTHNLFARLRHSLRTEIDQIAGYSQLLQEELETLDRPDLLADLQRIEGAGARLMRLVDGLLDVRPAPPGREDGRQTAESGASVAALDLDTVNPTARILVVDDNELNRDLLSRRLRRQGFEVEVAMGGSEALRLIASTDFHLVLLDITMPDISGPEVLETIRRDRSPADLPIIMVTARSGSRDVVETLGAGANDFVSKPIDFPAALARIRTQLALKYASDRSAHLARQLELRNQMIRRVFGRYLTDEVVASLLEQPEGLELGGKRRKLSILMADLRGFSGISERLPAEQIVRLLNGYLGAMAEVIIEHGGTIDEFIGDAILVLFGAPLPRRDHARAAVACALQMQQTMARVNQRNAERGLPEVELGIGISSGDVVVGNIGSERRAKYGVVGHNVNLAARIESYTRGGQILVSESTKDEVGDELQVSSQFEVVPKGMQEAVRLFEVRALSGERLGPRAAGHGPAVRSEDD
jgi:adenylate cyclase